MWERGKTFAQFCADIRMIKFQIPSAGDYNIDYNVDLLIKNPLAALGLQTNLVAKAYANGTL